MRALLAAVAVSSVLHAQQAEPSLDAVIARMHAYLGEYAKHLPAMIATERYQQRVGSGMRRNQRNLVSDFGLIQVPGDSQWLGFREVFTVDGKPVADSAKRLAELFAKPSAGAVQQARRIAEESARFNIGPVTRTTNDPAFVLELLDARNKGRMEITKAGDARIEGTRVWVLRFAETGRPTITRTRDLKNLPAKGRAWVDPQQGTILRVEASVEPGFGVTASLDVAFAHDEGMGFAVPLKMTERYTNRNLVNVSTGEANYSNYRRFTVHTEENIRAQ